MRKYFTDLKSEKGVKLTVVPVAIIGRKYSGKTSLLRSLKSGRRTLTCRSRPSLSDESNELLSEGSFLEEATKVFEVHDLRLPNAELKMIDFGGHEIYHIAYQLMVKERYLPMIVVNMEEFDIISSSRGPKEATRKTCFDWMSHVYLACPGLGPPILVLTHTDRLTAQRFEERKIQLLKMAEVLRQEWLVSERERGGQPANRVVHLSNEQVSVFSAEDIFEFSNDTSEVSNIRNLTSLLDERCQAFHVTIPRLWEKVSEFIDEQQDSAYLDLSQITSVFSDDDCLIIIRFMHNTGSIL